MAIHQLEIGDSSDRFLHATPAARTTRASSTACGSTTAVTASFGSVGDSYENSRAEAVINPTSTNCVRNPQVKPDARRWKSLDEVYLATVAWVG